MDNKVLLVFGLILFYLFFGLIYLAIGNTLNQINTDNNLPNLEYRNYENKLSGEDTNSLLSFVVNGIKGYSESDNVQWVNYIFIFLTALLIFSIIITILHG